MSNYKSNIISKSVISSLGFSVEENFSALKNNLSGVRLYDLPVLEEKLPLGKCDNDTFKEKVDNLNITDNYTRFEKFLILSVVDALKETEINPTSKDTIIIISTTKGNVDLIHDITQRDKLSLWYSAERVRNYFSAPNTPLVISNACISGVLALVHAHRLLSENIYKNAIVVGADILSDFVISGFNSFKSLSPGICKPFDESRDGLNIGEGAATIVLSNSIKGKYCISSGASANDANHISGPSRTGEGLYQAIIHTVQESNNFDYISAHGTATPYNDDMESIALTRAGLNSIPVNSYKAYIGHTLGAAGLIETVFSLLSMENGLLFKSIGCETPGVVEKINILRKNENKNVRKILKLASGFGGCNSAMIIEENF